MKLGPTVFGTAAFLMMGLSAADVQAAPGSGLGGGWRNVEGVDQVAYRRC
jgi:hypothetical protein